MKQDTAEVEKLLNRGLSVKEIARRLSCRPNAIYYALCKAGNSKSEINIAKVDNGKERKCVKCKLWKDREKCFYRQPENRLGLARQCKACAALYSRACNLSKYDGMAATDYEHLLKQQGNRCAICKLSANKLHVDHSHNTGKVRGLLCGSCNRGIGLLKDSPEILLAAAQYLS